MVLIGLWAKPASQHGSPAVDASRQHICQMLNHVPRPDPRVLKNVVATTEARDRDLRFAARPNRRKQPLLADRLGDVVMLDLMPEGARHPAAPAVDLRRAA